uniref:Calcium-dependent protein kinase 13 n=1 Tax=Rhizophora mucronata TaxID=61149 RepID=A0A2P2JGC4_RHIMU
MGRVPWNTGSLLLFPFISKGWLMMSIFTRHFPTLTRMAMVSLNQMNLGMP